MKSSGKLAVLAMASAALAVGAVAPSVAAASIWVGNGEGEATLKVKAGALVPVDGQHIFAPSNFKCNLSNLALVPKRVPLKSGKIDFVGKAYQDVFRTPKALGTLTWKGTLTKGTIRFRAPQTLKATVRAGKFVIVVKKTPCDTGTLRYTVRP